MLDIIKTLCYERKCYTPDIHCYLFISKIKYLSSVTKQLLKMISYMILRSNDIQVVVTTTKGIFNGWVRKYLQDEEFTHYSSAIMRK